MVNIKTTHVACFGFSDDNASMLLGRREGHFHFLSFSSVSEFLSVATFNKFRFAAILFETASGDEFAATLKRQLEKTTFNDTPVFAITNEWSPAQAREASVSGIKEVFVKPSSAATVCTRLSQILGYQDAGRQADLYEYKLPWSKRLFDIVFASLALLLLSPLFLIIAVLVRLESKGPVFYYSLRVGTGYKIFKFYKFRSMSADADKKLSQLKHLNQYAAQEVATAKVKQLCDTCAKTGSACRSALYADNEMWCEKLYKEHLLTKGQQAFVKIKDDPRITRVGKFIRNTSIDELPQLWNVVKGDMSLVGNRPLPLYEAEKLTTDKYALRFMAPAGITGLWQVSKRGQGKMSEEERISLDNDYAKSYGLFFDIKLLLRTIPALLQKENV